MMQPSILKSERRWMLWRRDDAGGKGPAIGWGRGHTPLTYDEAWALGKAKGLRVGIILGAREGWTPLSGIDLDDCLALGRVRPWAQEVLGHFPSYTEISPSGSGLKTLVLGGPPYLSRCRKEIGPPGQRIEAFVSGRWFAFTGNVWSGGHNNMLAECDAGWAWMVDRLGASTVREAPVAPEHTIDPEVLEEMLSHIPVEDYRDEYFWTGLMMSCHHATNGEGEDVWVAWSISDSEFSEHAEVVRTRWNSLSVDRGVGWKPLVAALRRAGKTGLLPPAVLGANTREWPDDE